MTLRLDPGLDIFIASDLHLGDGSRSDPFGRQDERFCAFLDLVRRQGDALVLAGDGFDLAQAWSLRRIQAAHRRVFEALTDLAREIPVIYLQGNHDGTAQALSSLLPFRYGNRLYIGDRVRVEHGNAFDPRNQPGDTLAFWGARAHALLERTIRSPVRIPIRKHYCWSTRLGHWLFFRYGLLLRGEARALRWLGREREARRHDAFLDYWGRGEWGDAHGLLRPVRKFLRRSAIEVLVCGHSHQAGRLALPGGSYLNAGSWTFGDATYVRFQSGQGRVFEWPGGREIGDEEYRGVLGASREQTFFSWWKTFYQGWFRYDVEAMQRSVRGEG